MNLPEIKSKENNLNNFIRSLHTYREKNKYYKESMQKKFRAIDSKFKIEISPVMAREENPINGINVEKNWFIELFYNFKNPF